MKSKERKPRIDVPWNCKMTEEDQKEIIRLYLEGKSARDILKHFNGKWKTTKTVYDLLRKFNIQSKEQWEYAKHDHFYFSKIDTPAKAYILGLLISDGWVYSPHNQVGIQMQEKELITWIKKEWKTENKVLCIEPRGERLGPNGKIINSIAPLYRILINSPKMLDNLKRFRVIDRKSLIAILPVLEDKSLESHLLRGILDGDGTIYTHSNGKDICIRFIGSHYLVAQIALYLNLEIGLEIRFPSISECKSISFIDYSKQEQVIKLGKYLYRDKEQAYFLERKHALIKNLIS